VRYKGIPHEEELFIAEFEKQLQDAAEIYGHKNLDKATLAGRSWTEANSYFDRSLNQT